ncbi:Acyl-CoA dehydrogenase [gamma proteobacterium HdN1]|nr:Acyl-CoA dehydrogenase [gamma proteobacterium HdN1]
MRCIMDIETLTLLGDSVRSWCEDNASLLGKMEHKQPSNELLNQLYGTFNSLGILSILGEQETHHEIEALAEVATQLAYHSPSIAVMVVQQNMAAWLFTEAGKSAPEGWISLPVYDAASEWRFQINHRYNQGQLSLDGRWSSLPLLNVATHALLPIAAKEGRDFQLILLPLTQNERGLSVSAPAVTLGLRACPTADLQFAQYDVKQEHILLSGEKARACTELLWSHAETCMMAIRAGIAKASYRTARDYAAQRYQGGKIIIEHSLIRKMLADFYRETCAMDESWRMMAQGLQSDQPLRHGQVGVALKSGDLLPWLTSDGIQILGGVGYMEDYIQERRFRDAKQCEFLLGHPHARTLNLWHHESE